MGKLGADICAAQRACTDIAPLACTYPRHFCLGYLGAIVPVATGVPELVVPHVAGDYMGEHWLATFALLAVR